ncbi:hypothetical protein BGZ94_007897, partial [Podila epigama]
MAVPPPLIPPLSLQTQAFVGTRQLLPTPDNSTNDTSNQQWHAFHPGRQPTEDTREQGPNNQLPDTGGLSSPALASPAAASLPSQLLSRLYPFSTTVTPSTDVSCASSSLQGTSRSGLGMLYAFMQQGSGGSGSSLRQSLLRYPVLNRSVEIVDSSTVSSEQTRSAAVSAIADTLQQRNGRPQRGSSPYIPSSLSMLFSDPEVMQSQSSLESTGFQTSSRQRRYSRSRRPFRRRDGNSSNGEDSDLSDTYESESEDTTTNESQKLLRPKQRHFGYEVVQEDSYYPYSALVREEYLAPHEPSSSSPLFPSPLTTLGRFGPGAILHNSTD